MDAKPDEPISTLGTPMRIKSTDWLPMGHSPAYEACDRVELVAGCDLRQDVLEEWGERFNVSADHLYTDYKEMLAAEQPDILSVVTQPEHRAEILIFAAEHGVRALFPEKAFAASLDEAKAVVAAATANNVVINMGTLRRYEESYDVATELIHSGKLGKLKTIIAHSTANLFNGSSHTFDAVNRLNGDAKPIAIMGEIQIQDGSTADLNSGRHSSMSMITLADGTVRPLLDKDQHGGNILRSDPVGHGIVEYDNGVTAYMLNSGRGTEFEAICERGIVSAWNDGETWRLREPRGIHQLDESQRERW
jgi:predicted dehydrogenase